MSHSRIVQVFSKCPTKEMIEELSSDTIENMSSLIDYVEEITDADAYFDQIWNIFAYDKYVFKHCIDLNPLKGKQQYKEPMDEPYFNIKIGLKYDYFKEQYDIFHDEMERLCNASMSEFADWYRTTNRFSTSLTKVLYQINSEEFTRCGGYHIVLDNDYYLTITDFMRRADTGSTFWIGRLFNYHY